MANAPIFGAPDDWSMLMSSHDIVHQTLPINDYGALYGSFEQQDTICSYLVTNHDTHVNNAHVASFGHESWPNTDFMAEASLSYNCEADHAETSLSHSFGDSGITCAHYGPPMDNNPNYPISISLTPADDVTDVQHHDDIAQPGYQFAHNSTARLGLEYFDVPPMVSVAACPDEHNFFSSNAAMDWKHIRSQHVRPLFCIFHYAGCMLRFASKNEWKRHILYQHLNLQYWVCTEGTCGRKERSQTETCALPMPTRGSIFNRKDLYAQHIRRMHLVHGDADTQGSKARMRELQVKAARTRCTLPDFMLCPVPECPSKFVDSNAWDNWMEHVAAHMQRGAAGEHVLVGFGGPENWTLTNWAASEAVAITRQTSAGTWALRRPIHGRGACKMDVSQSATKW